MAKKSSKYAYKADAEWDLGVNGLYSTEKKAWKALEDAYNENIADGRDQTFESAKKDGLLFVEKVRVW